MTDVFRRDYVRLRRETFGLLYAPTPPSKRTAIGLVVMHPNSNYLDHIAGAEMATRGFQVLCVNGQYFNTRREYMIWEEVPLDVKVAVEYLRRQSDMQAVVLVGHSGGGQLMPFYQQLAERPSTELPPADALVLLDAHHGYAANTLTALDPAVLDPTLDIFSPENGYDPAGSHYSAEFRARYFRGQAERMLRLNALARERLRAIESGTSQFPDDEAFLVPRGQARIWQLDSSLVSRTRQAHPILKGDGATVVDVARSVRVAGVTPAGRGEPGLTPAMNASFHQGAVSYTVRSWLSSNALQVDPDRYNVTEDAIVGIDWHSSNTSTPANIEGVRAPTLIMAMTGHYWLVSAETFFECSASVDKELVFVEGASHNIVPCRACESVPGEYGDTVKRTFDYVTEWLDHRFG
jgi:hypothetical protein